MIHLRMTRRVAFACLLLCGGVGRVAAQPVDEQGRMLTHELMSPFCPGLLLADCRSEGARQLRDEIGRRVAAGEAPAAIEDDLAARFGPTVRAVPAFQGIGAFLWTAPGLFGVFTLAVAVRVIRRATGSRGGGGPVARQGVESLDAGMAARIDEELGALD
jgi:cytochrome c-type biogenesis protein CcmH